eukprot:2054457-Rhodomonas_salina.1
MGQRRNAIDAGSNAPWCYALATRCPVLSLGFALPQAKGDFFPPTVRSTLLPAYARCCTAMPGTNAVPVVLHCGTTNRPYPSLLALRNQIQATAFLVQTVRTRRLLVFDCAAFLSAEIRFWLTPFVPGVLFWASQSGRAAGGICFALCVVTSSAPPRLVSTPPPQNQLTQSTAS